MTNGENISLPANVMIWQFCTAVHGKGYDTQLTNSLQHNSATQSTIIFGTTVSIFCLNGLKCTCFVFSPSVPKH